MKCGWASRATCGEHFVMRGDGLVVRWRAVCQMDGDLTLDRTDVMNNVAVALRGLPPLALFSKEPNDFPTPTKRGMRSLSVLAVATIKSLLPRKRARSCRRISMFNMVPTKDDTNKTRHRRVCFRFDFTVRVSLSLACSTPREHVVAAAATPRVDVEETSRQQHKDQKV